MIKVKETENLGFSLPPDDYPDWGESLRQNFIKVDFLIRTLTQGIIADDGRGNVVLTEDIIEKLSNIENCKSHITEKITTKQGEHGIRFFEDKLEYFNGQDWIEVETGGGGIPPIGAKLFLTEFTSSTIFNIADYGLEIGDEIDIFMTGGGGAAGGESNHYGTGGAGGGGYVRFIENFALSLASYNIVIGAGGANLNASGGSTSAFGYTVDGGIGGGNAAGLYGGYGGPGGNGGNGGGGSAGWINGGANFKGGNGGTNGSCGGWGGNNAGGSATSNAAGGLGSGTSATNPYDGISYCGGGGGSSSGGVPPYGNGGGTNGGITVVGANMPGADGGRGGGGGGAHGRGGNGGIGGGGAGAGFAGTGTGGRGIVMIYAYKGGVS